MYSDNEIIAEWQSMLAMFKDIDINNPESKENYLQLIELAKINSKLTPHQRTGIIDRCNNAINGEYGNTKRPEHYQQGKPEKQEKK